MRPEGASGSERCVNGADAQALSAESASAQKDLRNKGLVCSNELTKRCAGSPSACGGASTPVRWYLGRQRAILITLAIRPIRPRVASNAITPRPTANLVGPPLLVLFDLPVVASEHTEQISHGPLAFKGSMAIPPISVCSVSTDGLRHRQRADGLRTGGRFSRRLQLGPGL